MSIEEQNLYEILEKEITRIERSFPVNNSIHGVIEIIRSLDYSTYILNHKLGKKDLELLEKYMMGWTVPFTTFYKNIPDDYDSFPVITKAEDWADSVIQHGGSIQLCKQFLEYVKAGLSSISQIDKKTFSFNLNVEIPDEYFERLSIQFYSEFMNTIVFKDKVAELVANLPEMRKSLKEVVKLGGEKFITYKASDKMDTFYSKFAYLYLMTTQLVEEFDEEDKFGDHKYKDFLDISIEIIKSGIMHRDCCMALAEKTSHKVYIRDILTYGFSLQKHLSSLSKYKDWHEVKTHEILSCFAITKENYQYHLKYPGAYAAPYFELGKDFWIRSSFGCLNSPISFLNRELKRKYPKDYFNAVNNREFRFRSQLYSLFQDEKIIKVLENINIKGKNSHHTDIDGVMFNTETKSLAIIQLKWQDVFSSSMQERRSRISNLISKSISWIDGVHKWLENYDSKTIINTLKLEKYTTEIKDVYIFIIARNHTHFTNQALDERAIWASWYQIIQSNSIKDEISSDPIVNFATKLKAFYPANRKRFEGFKELNKYNFNFGGYSISINPKKHSD